MSDLVIRHTDGWAEITHLVDQAVAAGSINVNEIWRMAGQDRTQDIEGHLRMSQSIGDFFGQRMPIGFRVIMVPDSVRGEYIRVWVTLRRVPR